MKADLTKPHRLAMSGFMIYTTVLSLRDAWRMGHGIPTPELDHTISSVRMCLIVALVNASCAVWLMTGKTPWWLAADRWLRRVVLVGGVFISGRHVYAAIYEDYRVPRALSVTVAIITGLGTAAIVAMEIDALKARNREAQDKPNP